MPLRLEIRERARSDLLEIVRFIAAKNGDFTTAEKLGQRLLDRCENLAKAPGMGAPYLSRLGVRKLNEGPYKIFYLTSAGSVIVVRIWDGRREKDPRV
jgi:plasmid stabilization system protein ParE